MTSALFAADRAYLAAALASSILIPRINSRNSGSEGQAIESAVISNPKSRKAPKGFDAISPQTLGANLAGRSLGDQPRQEVLHRTSRVIPGISFCESPATSPHFLTGLMV